MDNNAWAVIDSDGIVVNIIVWNGTEEWLPPEGMTVINCGDKPFSIATVFRARLRSMLVIHRIPCFILFQHCVQDGQQFSDAGRQCNFFRFSCGNQACIELFNYRVVPRPNQG